MSARYAFYFSPATNTELAIFGERCLGRTSHQAREPEATSSFSDQGRWLSLTSKPAHYGFHATLKAPFELCNEMSVDKLMDSAHTFAASEAPISLSGLAPDRLSHFLALTLADQPDSLTEFAQRCVEAFEEFRLPLSDSDRQRRLQQSLNERQQTLLHRFGYPYVAEQFRFHMTLSGKLADGDLDFVDWATREYQQTVKQAPVLDRISVFMQADRKSAFTRLADFPFRQSQH